MLNQAFVQLEEIPLDLFSESAVVQEEFSGNTLWMGFGPEALGDVSFFDRNFFHTKKKLYTPAYVIKTNRKDFLNWLAKFNHELELKVIQNFDQQYKNDVTQIKEWIEQNKIQKMVAITCERYAKPVHFNPFSVLYKCLSSMPGTLYGYWDQNYGMIGMTPEPLFVCEQTKCFTFALAGTISTDHEDYQKRLASDPKELSEHQMVIEDIKTKLNAFESETIDIKIEPTQLLSYGTIAHLKTKIYFSTKDLISSFKLVDSLSPTAALGGYPQVSAIALLKKTSHFELLQNERMFGGTVGIQYPGFQQALVAIRNLQWDQNTIWIESGSGIVAESNVNKELVEVQNKRKSVKNAFIVN